MSLSVRRAWIEMRIIQVTCGEYTVALREESVDRNGLKGLMETNKKVALREESVDRNKVSADDRDAIQDVALREESVG